ncbi:hypothetical protein ABNA99_003454, partial [Escherichia coli]
EILISESAWEEMTCLFAPSLVTLTKHNSAPGEWKTEIIEHSPSVPCGDEFNALQEILSSTPGVFWKPRKRKEYIVDSSDLRKYQILGFEDYNHYVGYLATNGLNNLVPEFQILDNADHYGDF